LQLWEERMKIMQYFPVKRKILVMIQDNSEKGREKKRMNEPTGWRCSRNLVIRDLDNEKENYRKEAG
jgi:hypothetical protein